MKLRRIFSQRMHPTLSFWLKTHVLGCFGPFRYSTKIGAKRAELAPLANMFAKRSFVGFFHNERNQSTPFDQKLIFWGVSDRFRYCTKINAKRAELVPLANMFAKRSCIGFFRNECTQSSMFDSKLMFWGISVCFVTARKSVQNRPNWCH